MGLSWWRMGTGTCYSQCLTAQEPASGSGFLFISSQHQAEGNSFPKDVIKL